MVRRLAWSLLAAVTVLVLSAVPASAHSEIERSDPPNGGMVAVGRTTLSLSFGERVNTGASTFELHSRDGTRAEATVEPAGRDGGRVVQLSTAPLAFGIYSLDWRVLSLEDGHPSSGSIVFGVGLRPVLVPSGGAVRPEGPSLVLRWVDLSAMLLAIGALAVSGRVLGSMGEAGAGPRRRARRIAAAAAGLAIVSGALTPVVRTQRGGSSLGEWAGQIWATLTGTPWGHLWLARELAVLLAAGALLSWATRRPDSAGRVRIALVALVASAWLEGWAGHASALPTRSALAGLAASAHLVAAGVWAGGLVVLALCVLPVMRRAPDLRGPVLASVWRTFSPRAAVASVVLLATGLYEAGRHVPTLGSVTATLYGGAVAAKTLLVLLALALAAVNTLVVNPRLAARVGRAIGRPEGWAPVSLRRFTTVVMAEVLVLVVAAWTAAVLTSVPTAREIAAAAPVTAPAFDTVDGLFLTVEDVPAGPHRSRLIVRVRATVLPEPAPVTGVVVRLVGPRGRPSRVTPEPVEPGRYEAEKRAPSPGRWTARVAVHRAGLPDSVARVRWTVAAPTSNTVRPLEVVTTGVAGLLLAALLTVVWHARVRRPPAAPGPVAPVLTDASRR